MTKLSEICKADYYSSPSLFLLVGITAPSPARVELIDRLFNESPTIDFELPLPTSVLLVIALMPHLNSVLTLDDTFLIVYAFRADIQEFCRRFDAAEEGPAKDERKNLPRAGLMIADKRFVFSYGSSINAPSASDPPLQLDLGNGRMVVKDYDPHELILAVDFSAILLSHRSAMASVRYRRTCRQK